MSLAKSLALSAIGFTFSCSASMPSIEWDAKIKYIDADILAREKNVSVDFWFTNNGTDVLKIYSVVASCGCLVPYVKKNEYLPGESGHLIAKYNGVGPKKSAGVKLYVRSNNGDELLGVKVIKQSFAHLSVDLLSWLVENNGETKTSILTLEKEGVIKSITSSEPGFRASCHEQISKREFLLEVTPASSSIPKRGLINVIVDYGDSDTENLALLVKVH